MEEIKPPQSTAIEAPVPPPTTLSQPSHSLPPIPPKTKKRPLDTNAFLHYSNMRAVIRDLRPHFIEVLKTPDFRNGKAAKDIRERIKLLQDLYILMVTATSESLYIEKTSNVLDGQSLCVDNQDRRSHDGKQEDKSSSYAPEKQWANDGQVSGAYIVGRLAFGWNFIAFTGTEPVYYGVTKEVFREKKSHCSIRIMIWNTQKRLCRGNLLLLT